VFTVVIRTQRRMKLQVFEEAVTISRAFSYPNVCSKSTSDFGEEAMRFLGQLFSNIFACSLHSFNIVIG
jgi:hypothetical protein